MIPAPFDYEVAESVDHAIELLGTREEAKVLEGGHSLQLCCGFGSRGCRCRRRGRPAGAVASERAT